MLTGPRPILVVGLQKSGTSLLKRLLVTTGIAADPFGGKEADWLWGNEPPLSPAGEPVGRLYQRAFGERGHRLERGDATGAHAALLAERLDPLRDALRPVVNKNPYNSVRIPWLRAVLPDAVIVGAVRTPVANVYSLVKKHQPQDVGRPPEEGWWGVKPPAWRALVQDDKIAQSAAQWAAVNRIMLADRPDLVVDYASLCRDPEPVLRAIEAAADAPPLPGLDVPELRCYDDEYTRGSRLRSKNRYFRETGTLATPADEPLEFPPFGRDEVAAIEQATTTVSWPAQGGSR